MIPSAVGGNTIGKRTVPGAMNTSFFNFGDDASKTIINWEHEVKDPKKLVVYSKIGVYDGRATLIPGKGTKFLENVELSTTATGSFSFLPTTF